MYKDNKDLYPTPKELANKMLSKVDWKRVKTILEPSAGLGNLIEAIKTYDRFAYHYEISAIEIDNKCRNFLIGAGINVIDSDFLLYNGLEQFDLIVANFPFSDGDKHLHKALDVLFSGQIVCLLNAETIKNPYSNSRQDLIKKLNKLNASIEYIENAFLDAERKTGVEVALIYIEKYQTVETELFNDMVGDVTEVVEDIKESKEIATRDSIKNIVLRYNQEKETVISQIIEFYKNYKKVSKYLSLTTVGEDIQKYSQVVKEDERNLTDLMKSKLNYFSKKIKKDYWLEAMQLDEVSNRLTSKKKKELSNELNLYSNMDFTEANIKIFIENLIAKYPIMIDEAIEYVFDEFTKYSYRDESRFNEYKGNTHLYNGWKTNQAFKVNKKVILPFYVGWQGVHNISWEQEQFFDDLDLVFNYFDDKNLENELLEYKDKYSYSGNNVVQTKQTGRIVRQMLAQGETKNIKTRYFIITVYKKGTVHFVFNDLDMLRKFNIYIGKKKNFLPDDYGYTTKQEFDGFESAKEYKQIKGSELSITSPSQLLLGFN
jgi:hypothetical protein